MDEVFEAVADGFWATGNWIFSRLWRGVRKLCFSTWKRCVATGAVASLAAVHYFPVEATPVVQPIWQLGVTLLGMRIILIPIWPMKKAKKS